MGARQSGQATSSAGSRGHERSQPGFWQYIGRSAIAVARYTRRDGTASAIQASDHKLPSLQRQNSAVMVQATTVMATACAFSFICMGDPFMKESVAAPIAGRRGGPSRRMG